MKPEFIKLHGHTWEVIHRYDNQGLVKLRKLFTLEDIVTYI